MNKTISIILAFVGGAAAGVAASWKLLKTTYERIADEEIASIKEHYAAKLKELENSDSEKIPGEENEKDVSDMTLYEAIVHDLGYDPEAKEGGSNAVHTRPYLISPVEFGEGDYDLVTLKYFSDGYLTYENNELIDDVEDLIGEELLTHYGEYEDDCIYVRDDLAKRDYEIIYDLARYQDVADNTDTDPEGLA